MKKKIYLATDHAGFGHKEFVKEYINENFCNFEVIDCGAFDYDPDDDYPDFISKAAEAVSKDPENTLAVIFGGSGQGEAMLANRFKNVRATVYYGYEKEILFLSKEHNNANILSIGARFVPEKDLPSILNLWIFAEFSNKERHLRRIKKIEKF